MTLLASVMLLASACTGKQASEKTASGQIGRAHV